MKNAMCKTSVLKSTERKCLNIIWMEVPCLWAGKLNIFKMLILPNLSINLSEFTNNLAYSVGKESACNAGNPGSIPVLGRYPGEGNGNPLQYSCLENPLFRGAWQATVCEVARVGLDWVTKHNNTTYLFIQIGKF